MRVAERERTSENVSCVSINDLNRKMRATVPQASEELVLAFLSAWVGLIQDAVLDIIERDANFLNNLETGQAKLRLNRFLAPVDRTLEAMTQDISLEINLHPRDTKRLAEAMQSNFKQNGIIRLEALGLVAPDEAAGYLVSLNADFINPVVAFPPRPDY